MNNAIIPMQDQEEKFIKRLRMVRFLAIVFFSDFSGISIDEARQVLSMMNFEVHRVFRFKYVLTNLLAFPPTDRGNMEDDVWFAARDSTQCLENMEKSAYEMSTYIFLFAIIHNSD